MRKYTKVIVATTAALALSMCLFGCGGSDNGSSNSGEQKKEAVEQQADADNPNNVKIGKGKMQGDYAGKKRLVVELEWTNNTDETAEFYLNYIVKAYQDDEEIDRTFGDGDGWYNDQKSVKPGKTQTIKMMFDSKSGKDVDVEVEDMWGSDVIVSKTFEL